MMLSLVLMALFAYLKGIGDLDLSWWWILAPLAWPAIEFVWVWWSAAKVARPLQRSRRT